MDLLFPSPDPVSTNLMGSDYVRVPELESEFVPSTLEEGIKSPDQALIPPPPPLKPAPVIMDDARTQPATCNVPSNPNQSNIVISIESAICQPQKDLNNFPSEIPACLSVTDASGAVEPVGNSQAFVTTGPQIMTRKRSSMSAVSAGVLFGTELGTCSTTPPSANPMPLGAQGTIASVAANLDPSPPAQPPKKKKKSSPKPKKSPEASAATGGVIPTPGSANGSSKSKSKAKKAPEQVVSAPVVATPAAVSVGGGSEVNPVVVKPAPKKKSSKPKAPKKSTSGGSSKSKSKKKQPATLEKPVIGGLNEPTSAVATAYQQQQLVPPLKLQMPKLVKMTGTGALTTTQAMNSALPVLAPEWEDSVEQLDPVLLAETEMAEDGADEPGNTVKGSSRKKKSKGRNGNIYIGVFNRIEWMKLQNEFGFGSVNNFGTFVLQTMRRVHGDIQFWCDVAVASGLYPELDRYEWTNGFPHAVNKEGQVFTPELDVTVSDEKREELSDMAKGMWEQRLQKLKQEQQALMGEEEVALLDGAAEEGEEEEEEYDDPMPGLENYLENMANGEYSPLVTSCGEVACTSTTTMNSTATTESGLLTDDDVNRIWNEQLNDSDSLEKFGKLFSFINSIATVGKRTEEDNAEGAVKIRKGQGQTELVKTIGNVQNVSGAIVGCAEGMQVD